MSRFGTLPRRLVHLVIVLFGITLVTFLLLRLIPGDPALAILGSSYTHDRAVAIDNFLGLNRPIWTQHNFAARWRVAQETGRGFRIRVADKKDRVLRVLDHSPRKNV